MGGGKTETQYEVKWKGWDKKHNTYEPLSNLVGCEDMVSEYKERKRQRILAESEAMSLYHIKEMIKESEEQRTRQFQELKERVQRLSEQNYKLFSELLYQHKFAKTA